MGRRVLALFCCLSSLALSGAGLVFEWSGEGSEQWDFLDLRGDGKALPAQDGSGPPGYGPNVLGMSGTVYLAMAKGAELSEGTIVALYRENEARDFDADGVILFWADYPQDISVAHNTKEWRPHVWLEQDNDCGFQFRFAKTTGEEDTLAERPGHGVVTDDWNKTKWIWQKVRLEGDRIQAKYWPAEQPEPDEWGIEATHDGPRGGRFGLKINSGDIHLAYFAADAEDIAVDAPSAYLHFTLPRATQARRLPFTLFTNSPDAARETFSASVTSGSREVGSGQFELDIPAGQGEFPLLLSADKKAPEGGAEVIGLDKEPGAGTCAVRLSSASGTYDADCRLEVAPARELQNRMSETAKAIAALGQLVDKGRNATAGTAALTVIRDAAQAHLDYARALLEAGKPEDAELALRFATEALAELKGYKGAWVRELGGKPEQMAPDKVEGDKRGFGEAERITEACSTAFQMSFGEPQLEAQSFVMGQAYEMTLPWQVEGAAPEKDYAFEVRLVSPLGNRTVAQSSAQPAVPTSQWEPGQANIQKVRLDVLPEDPSKGVEYLSQPPVLDEAHRIVVSVSDPESGARLLLGNAPGPQPERVGSSAMVAEVYVSSTPLEIRGFEPKGSPAMGTRMDRAVIRNVGAKPQSVDALFSAKTETGRSVLQAVQRLQVDAGADVPVEFNWTPKTAGNVTLHIQLLKDGVMATEAKAVVVLTPPASYDVRVASTHHVERRDGVFVTPLNVSGGGQAKGTCNARVIADGRLVGEGEGPASGFTVDAEPWFGYYDVEMDFGTFRSDARIIATVAETNGMDLLVNGEPFLVKGVNVHGMDGSSPERTASMMRIMRDLGFNTWRGDYPARWQVDLAYEMNTCYMVLAPFSCAGTDEIFARQDGPPLTTARELSRVFVERYVDSAGVLMWNSCNEIGGETIDFLLSLYPVYKAHDPYQRPVNYANLYGQDFTAGQDVMGVNYYFGRGQTAVGRQPNIARSIALAREADMPVIFCEFNSYHGAIQSTGAESMYDLYDWGVREGMSGGVQYMKGNSDRHPGIFDNGFNTHKIYDDAIRYVLADAKVSLAEAADGKVILEIRNKRRCTLRQVTLNAKVSGQAVEAIELDDLPSQETAHVDMQVPRDAPGPAVTVEGVLEFVTHYGFRCRVPFSAVAAG